MNELEWVKSLINPVVFGSLTAIPFVLQLAKGFIPGFNVKVASIVSALSIIVLVIFVARPMVPEMGWWIAAVQVVIAWVYVQLVYVKAFGPAAESDNPLIPATLPENKGSTTDKKK